MMFPVRIESCRRDGGGKFCEGSRGVLWVNRQTGGMWVMVMAG